jgi:purine-binding chemotaxis protein CheW
VKECSLDLLGRAVVLRSAFDLTFAAPPAAERPSTEAVLSVGLGRDTYGLRLSEVAGLFAHRSITRLPSSIPEFLGVAGLRGVIVPVFSLGALLAYPAEESPRWLLLAGGQERIGLAFARLEGHFLSARTVATRAEGDGELRPHVQAAAATVDGRVLALIDLPSVVRAITSATQSTRDNPTEESR